MDATGAPVSPVVVGRARERAELAALLTAARSSETGLVLLSGEAGVGKTRLVDETTRLAAASGMRVLSGHCVQLGSEGLPFAPLVEALRELARSTPPEQLASILGPARRLMPRLVPALGDAPEGAPEQGSQLLESVLSLLERLAADQPLLVVLEDLHWADRSTLDLAAYLVQALRGVPVALLVTYRSDELHRRHPLRSLVVAWERMRSVRHLELSRFDLEEVRELAAAILGTAPDHEVAETLFVRSEGNAFLVEELVGLVRDGGDPAGLPPSLRDLLLARVDTLGEGAQRLVRFAAVGGPEVDEQLLLAASRDAPEDALPALRESVDAHLLLVAGPGYRFRHALVRDAVYDDMLPGERGRLHGAYGAAIEARPELIPDPTARAAATAFHWFAALDLPKALVASVTAARLSVAGLAPTEGLGHFERALQLWPRVADAADLVGVDQVAVLLEAAHAAHLSGAVDRAVALLTAALDELPAGDRLRRAGALERQAEALRDLGRLPQAGDAAERGLALLAAESGTVEEAALLATLANLLLHRNDAERARTIGERAVEAACRADARAIEADARLTVGVAHIWLGAFDDALDELRAATTLAREAGAMVTTLRGVIDLAHVLEMLGRSAEAAGIAEDGLLLAERSGLARTHGAYLAGNLAESLLHLGEWSRAETLIAHELRMRPEGLFAATLLDIAAHVAALRGRFDDAERRLGEAVSMVGDVHDPEFAQPLAFTAALLLEREGQRGTAVDRLLDAVVPNPSASPYAWPLLWLTSRIEADRLLAGEAAPDPRTAALIGRMTDGTPPQRAYAALAAAELDRGRSAATSGQWLTAAGHFETCGWPYPRAYALHRAAEALSLDGDTARATATLQEAAEVARSLGATPLVVACAEVAQRARLPLPDPSTPGAAAVERRLTARELEVLRLLAAGRSNPQIAAELFISPKTASVHVSNILTKLEVATRVEAATLAQRSGLVTAV